MCGVSRYVRQRPNYYKDRRKPIPFDRPMASPMSYTDKERVQVTESPRDGFPWQREPTRARAPHRQTNIGMEATDSGPVIPHPPPLPWDDQEVVDLPYDNPYYTRVFDNVLWLPRDPVNVLDLDATVDMKISLTVDVSAGQVGTWLGLVQHSSPEGLEPMPSPEFNPLEISPRILPVSYASLPQVDGTEDIDLPPAIQIRVEANEPGIERTTRPRRSTVSSGRTNKSETASMTMLSMQSQRRPSTLGPQQQTVRSVSDGSSIPPPPFLRARSSSGMSALQLPPRLVAKSSEQEFGLRPDAHAQADLVAAITTNSKVSLTPSKMGKSQNLSAQHAILHEILAEEKQALLDRLEDEQVQATKSTSTKSWLISWMFKKSE